MLLFNIILAVLIHVIRHLKETKIAIQIEIGIKKIKLSLLAGDMIVYI